MEKYEVKTEEINQLNNKDFKTYLKERNQFHLESEFILEELIPEVELEISKQKNADYKVGKLFSNCGDSIKVQYLFYKNDLHRSIVSLISISGIDYIYENINDHKSIFRKLNKYERNEKIDIYKEMTQLMITGEVEILADLVVPIEKFIVSFTDNSIINYAISLNEHNPMFPENINFNADIDYEEINKVIIEHIKTKQRF